MLSRPANWLSTRAIAFSLVILAGAGCSDSNEIQPATSESYPSSLVTDWIDVHLLFAKESPGFTPPVVSRAFGYCGLAIYEAAVPGSTTNQSLVGQLSGLDFLPTPEAGLEYHWGLCANAAAAQITRSLFDNAPAPMLTRIDSLEDVYVALWAAAPASVRDRSIAFGRVLADSIYGYSKSDGGHKGYNRNFPPSYVPPAGPGLWAPGPQVAMLPYWGNNRTFIKGLKEKVTHAGFPPFSTDVASAFYAEANEVYTISQSLTAEQEDIAYYWADEGFVTFTPPGHSVSIFTQFIRQGSFNLLTAAEGYAKMGMAVSDAFVYCWNLKYTFNLVRPSMFIRPNINGSWIPLIPNPPFPEYTSGHSTQSGAAAEVLTSLFGDGVPFTDLTHTKLNLGLPARSFTSFYQMAEESGISRIYAGIHFPSANVQGRLSGYAIGKEVLQLDYTK